jgi:hypothetical protein
MFLVYSETGFVQNMMHEPVDDTYVERVRSFGFNVKRVPDAWMADKTAADIWVDPATEEEQVRPLLEIHLSRTAIKADGKRLATITGLPRPCTVLINGETHVIGDGRLDLVSDMPGDYEIRIDQWPYLPWSATVSAR